MSDLRPCVVKLKSNEINEKDYSNLHSTVEVDALFHRLGDSIGYADDVKVPLTVAIIELKESGKLMSVSPEKIRFTDQGVI